MIDLSKLKAGDTIMAEILVDEVKIDEISFVCGYGYTHFIPKETIKRITPAVFNWDDAKAGMAFRLGDGDVVHYIGTHAQDNSYAVAFDPNTRNSYGIFLKVDMTRVPAHDIEVK